MPIGVRDAGFRGVVGYDSETNRKDGATTMNLFVIRSWLQAKLGRDERGANLVEYILLVALIALAVIAAVVFLRGQVNSQFNNAGSHLSQGS